MRLLKLLALLILGPLVLALLFIIVVVAIIAVPLLWEQLTARLTAPPTQGNPNT